MNFYRLRYPDSYRDRYGEGGKDREALYFEGVSSRNTCPPAIYALVVAGGNFLMHRAG